MNQGPGAPRAQSGDCSGPAGSPPHSAQMPPPVRCCSCGLSDHVGLPLLPCDIPHLAHRR